MDNSSSVNVLKILLHLLYPLNLYFSTLIPSILYIKLDFYYLLVIMMIKKISLLIIMLMLVGTTSGASTPVTSEKNVSYIFSPTQVNPSLNENIQVHFGDDGYIWSYARISGDAIRLGDDDLQQVVDPSVRDYLSNVDIRTQDSDSPFDENAQIRFTFKTNDPNFAESLGWSVIDAFSTYVNIYDVVFSGSYGYVSETQVEFRGHIDWTGFQDLISRSIPRDKGGISASIDVSNARSLSFQFWVDADTVVGSVGVDFMNLVPTLNGGFNFSLKEFIPVTSFEPPASGELGIDINLPGVTNLQYSISNSSDTEVYINKYTDLYTDENQTYIRTKITGGSYSDIYLAFDYDFVPWHRRNIDNVWMNVDPRGYGMTNIDVRGVERAAPTANLLANSTMFIDMISLYFDMDKNVSSIPGYDGIRLDVNYPKNYNSTAANISSTSIVNELETLGITFVESDIFTSRWGWDPINQTDIEVLTTSFYGSITDTEFLNFISSSLIYQRSASLQAVTVSDADRFSWSIERDEWGYYSWSSLGVDQLSQGRPDPTPLFPQGISSTNTVSLFDLPLLGFGGVVPWNEYSDSLSINFQSYYDGNWDNLIFEPNADYGINWWSGRWDWSYQDYNYFQSSVTLRSSTPQMRNEDDSPGAPLGDVNVTFTSQFYTDNDDIDIPWGGLYLKTNETGYFWDDNVNLAGQTLSGTSTIRVNAFDNSYKDYWNGTQWVDRFPSSGISMVNASIYRTDAAVDLPIFNIPISFVPAVNYTDMWDSSIDTTAYPDGEWFISADITDKAGNTGNIGTSFLIDNYDDSYTPAEITWGTDVANNSAVEGIVTLTFNVTDDVGSYVTILWNNLGGNTITPDTITTVNGKEVQMFTFEFDTLTMGYENEEVRLTVETLDYDGHWSYSTLIIKIDNIKQGNPPTISNISPANGLEINATENPLLKFSALVDDDWGLKSVKLVVAGDKEFFMFLNETSGLYEVNMDFSNWTPGSYSWKIVATDVDENTHEVSSELRALVIIGVTSEDTSPPTLTLISPTNLTVSDSVEIVVEATDDNNVQQVTVEIPGGEVKEMTNSGTSYKYTWDSTQVADGSYTLTITARDYAGNSATLEITLQVSNGRTAPPPPELGVPGFELPIALFTVMVGAIILRRRKI